MPCWYYEKKVVQRWYNSGDGITLSARFIIDAGTKMGLYLFDCCAEHALHANDLGPNPLPSA